MRRMRIIAWHAREKDEPAYTLVMEWFNASGDMTHDQRYQMDLAEFQALFKSVQEASVAK